MTQRHGLIVVDVSMVAPRPGDGEIMRKPSSIKHLQRAELSSDEGGACP